jgi:hypothetical protein
MVVTSVARELRAETTKQIFNCDGPLASYLVIVRTTKELAMAVIASEHEFAINSEWISCSHWGLFPVRHATCGEA